MREKEKASAVSQGTQTKKKAVSQGTRIKDKTALRGTQIKEKAVLCGAWLKKEAVLCAAWLLAAVSMWVVKPDRKYVSYVDYKTLALLFCLMAVMAGLQSLGVFKTLGGALLGKVHSRCQVGAVLVFLCFFSSMAITNDVALLTFVPFALIVLSMAGLEDMVIPVVTLQTIGANLGSMMTPVGNPQNLYLYSRSGLAFSRFFGLMLPYGTAAFLLLVIWIGRLKNGDIGAIPYQKNENSHLSGLWVYLILFFLCVAAVAKLLPWQILLMVTVLTLGILNRKLFLKVDYSLLFTFVGFFVFIGNMKRIPAFYEAMSRIVAGHELAVAVGASQVISNVPAALLLSGFTDKWEALIVGTNLGGLGTLIASMASLISYKAVAREYPKKKGKYFLYFTVSNLLFLAVLYICTFIF